MGLNEFFEKMDGIGVGIDVGDLLVLLDVIKIFVFNGFYFLFFWYRCNELIDWICLEWVFGVDIFGSCVFLICWELFCCFLVYYCYNVVFMN